MTIYRNGWNDKIKLGEFGADHEEVFIGGTTASKNIAAGEYFMNLNLVAEEKDAKSGGPGGLYAFRGFQFVPAKIGKDACPRVSWGSRRVYLSRAGWKNGVPIYTGDENSPWYIHGHGRSFPGAGREGVDLTDGCVGCKQELALQWMEKVIRGAEQGVFKTIPVTVHY